MTFTGKGRRGGGGVAERCGVERQPHVRIGMNSN